MKKVIEQIQKAIHAGAFGVISANMLNKTLAFFNGIIIAHILSKSTYGIFSYSYSIIQFFLLFRGLGLNSGMLQFCSENISLTQKNSYYNFVFRVGNVINIGIAVLCIGFSLFFEFNIGGADYLVRLMCFIPFIMFVREYISMVLRSKSEVRFYALTTNIDTITNIIFPAMGAIVFDITGYVLGIYIGYLVSIIIDYRFIRKYRQDILRTHLTETKLIKALLSYSFLCCLTNTVSQSLYLVDTYLVGNITKSTEILADYRIAANIPSAFSFIPLSIMVFVTPYFAFHREDLNWLKINILKIVIYNGSLNCLLGIALLAGANLIIPTAYGEQYRSAVPIYCILVFSYIISSSLRIPLGNILSMIRMVKFNLIASILEGVLNIVLDVILIMKWGSIGAAYATLFVSVFSSVNSSAGILYYFYQKRK